VEAAPPTADVLTALSVDDDGIAFRGSADRSVDVHFDEQRIGSFWTQRDTDEQAGGQGRLWRWPDALRPYLEGPTTVTVVDHVSQATLGTADVVLGAGADRRISIVDGQGNPLGLDKSNRLRRLFASRSAEHTEPLLDAIEVVLGALTEAGVRPFIAYGTLLGAVREGALIGHDSDADLGYVSEHEHPYDVVIESFRLQRALVDLGYPVTRYSGLAFKVGVREGDGRMRGLDVFGGFLRDGQLHLMGEVRAPFRMEWMYPTSTTTLEGRELPAPAEPEHLLAAMYGPSWRVPDPAYKFETPPSTYRRLSGWFRGTQAHRDRVWDPFYLRTHAQATKPSAFVRWVAKRERSRGEVGAELAYDVGCGAGADVAFLAGRGITSTGFDYARRAFAKRAKKARKGRLPLRYEWMSLTELRSVLPLGVELSRVGGRKVMLARHVADATTPFGRANLLRLARMSLDGGRLYLQVATAPSPHLPHGVRPLDLATFLAEIDRSGGQVVARRDLVRDTIRARPRGDAGTPGATPYLTRLVVQWP
jgi:SAM-dependent methyltransferase